MLDREGLSVRAAHHRTGTAAVVFSRIRNADVERFTVDRLMSIINRLGSRIEVKVKVRAGRVKQLEEELHLKNVSEKRHAEEKALIRSRIDNLLANLEGVTRS